MGLTVSRDVAVFMPRSIAHNPSTNVLSSIDLSVSMSRIVALSCLISSLIMASLMCF